MYGEITYFSYTIPSTLSQSSQGIFYCQNFLKNSIWILRMKTYSHCRCTFVKIAGSVHNTISTEISVPSAILKHPILIWTMKHIFKEKVWFWNEVTPFLFLSHLNIFTKRNKNRRIRCSRTKERWIPKWERNSQWNFAKVKLRREKRANQMWNEINEMNKKPTMTKETKIQLVNPQTDAKPNKTSF